MLKSVLCCKTCHNSLGVKADKYICQRCFQEYPIENGILLLENIKQGVNLRIGDNLLNIHKLRNERKFFDSFIKNDIEYLARLQSINFTDFHADLVSPYISQNTIIADLGCGQLPYINAFKNFNFSAYYAFDLHKDSLQIARDNASPKIPLILVQNGMDNLPLLDNSIDIVISSEVLEHLENPKAHLRTIYKILKKGGVFSLSTPCASKYFYPHNFLFMLINPISWYKKINSHLYWKQVLGLHPALRPSILRKLIEAAGFRVKRHETKLWFYHTPVKLAYRLLFLLDHIGFPSAVTLFKKYLKLTESVLSSNLPIIKWCGIRQFVLAVK
jgi:SAM-dependent methyltransferase